MLFNFRVQEVDVVLLNFNLFDELVDFLLLGFVHVLQLKAEIANSVEFLVQVEDLKKVRSC